MAQNSSDNFRDQGLLFLRVGLGIMFIMHGLPKMLGGPEQWAGLGMAMANLGINFAPVFWGFMAAFAELVGGICLLLGFMFRPACGLLTFTMIVAALFHLKKGDGIMGASHAIELCIVFLGLIFIGAGKYRIDGLFKKNK
ncbi:MAG: DoxX family protein [Candidatus Omnitrophica bacterium]|nr:DoxX family protein [Candidatus Omnitrophota bacterium]